MSTATVTVRYTDRRVLAEIHRYTTLPKGAFPSYRTLAANLKLGISTVRGAVYRLIKAGVLKVTARRRRNGSQTTNEYSLCIPLRKVQVAPCSTPYEETKKLASSDAFLSGRREPSSRSKIKNMTKAAPADDWDSGAVAGALDPDPTASAPRAKAKVRSGNDEITRTGATASAAVTKPTRRQIERAIRAVRHRRARATKPIEQWNALDLADAWRERLWDKGFKTNLTSHKAIAARFKDLQVAGVSNERLDAMSQEFFTDPRHIKDVRTDLYKLFIAKSTELLADSARTGYYRQTPAADHANSPFARLAQAYAAQDRSNP